MKTVNKATLIGNLGHTPKVTYSGDLAIGKNTLATSFKRRDGDETTWHNLTFFGKGAEIFEKYCKKGDMLYVEGRISNSTYTGKDGNKKFKTEIIVEDFVMLGRRQRPGEDAEAPNAPGPASRDVIDKLAAEGIPATPEDFDDEIPF